MSNTMAEILEGKRPNTYSFFDTMQARARLRAGKGHDKDGTANEIILCLPYYVALQFHLWFLQLYQELDTDHPEQWKKCRFQRYTKDARHGPFL